MIWFQAVARYRLVAEVARQPALGPHGIEHEPRAGIRAFPRDESPRQILWQVAADDREQLLLGGRALLAHHRALDRDVAIRVVVGVNAEGDGAGALDQGRAARRAPLSASEEGDEAARFIAEPGGSGQRRAARSEERRGGEEGGS